MGKFQKIHIMALMTMLALVPLLAIGVPRILAFLPALVGVIGFLTYKPVFGEKPHWSKPAFVVTGLCVALMFASSLWAIDPDQSLSRAMKTSGLLLAGAFFISLLGAFRITALQPYLKLLPMAVFLTALGLCVEISLDYPLYRLIRGFEFSQDVSLAVFNRATVTVCLLLIPSIAIMREYYSDPMCMLIVALTIIPLLSMTESQSAQLALLMAAVVMFLFPYSRKWAWPAFGFIIFALMLALPVIAMWAFKHMVADIEAIPFFGAGGGYAGARMEIWDYVSRYIMQNPLYGFGVEATRQVPHFGSGEIYQQGQTILHPHNYALQLWMEFGLVGVTLGAAFIGYLLVQIGKLPIHQAKVALPTLIAVLSVASTGYGMWQGWWLGLLFAVFAYCWFAMRLMESDGIDAMSNT